MDPGPSDRSVLYGQDVHRSELSWSGEVRFPKTFLCIMCITPLRYSMVVLKLTILYRRMPSYVLAVERADLGGATARL